MKNYEQEIIINFANDLISYGYEVYLSESGTYGFWINENKAVVYFQVRLGQLSISGKYESECPIQTGTGWQIVESLTNYDKERIKKLGTQSAPRWAVGTNDYKFLTKDEYLKKSSASNFKLYKESK